MKTYQAGERTRSPNLVRLNIHIKRKQAPILVAIAESIAQVKGRGVRLGEALELVLAHVAMTPRAELLQYLETDQQSTAWTDLAPVQSQPQVLLPALLRS